MPVHDWTVLLATVVAVKVAETALVGPGVDAAIATPATESATTAEPANQALRREKRGSE